jgi:hypothetical protein
LRRAATGRILVAVRRFVGVLAILGLVATVGVGVRRTSLGHEASRPEAHASASVSVRVSRGLLLPVGPLTLPRFPQPLIPGVPNPSAGRGTRCLISGTSTCSFAPCPQFVSAAPVPAAASPAGLLARPLASIVRQANRGVREAAPPPSGTWSCDRHPSADGLLIPIAGR